jgi:ABC-type nitrate/sulfonate/bicarbonate transport system ATPase subunit
MAELEARGISMVYESRGKTLVAIDALDLRVEEGEFVSIVGPSGCGKSTLLQIIDGLLAPTRGQVVIDGVPVSSPGRDRAMVFQDASLLPWFNVLRNASYGLYCQGVPRQEATEKAREILEIVGLGGFEDHYPHELSGGMQQRLNLARAFGVDPEVLLMDEPFAALDLQTRELMQAELLRVWEPAGKTVLFVTHAIQEAVYLSDRVIVMSARPGRIIADVRIDIPRPRPFHDKRNPEFLEYEDKIWHYLASEVHATMQRERVQAQQ